MTEAYFSATEAYLSATEAYLSIQWLPDRSLLAYNRYLLNATEARFKCKRGLLTCNRDLLEYTVVAGGTGGGGVVVAKQSV